MLKATAKKILPTTITGSLPRPSWYTETLGSRSFLDAMVTSRFREQYVDALSVYLREQEVAGLDIVTDGDCRFDQDVGGQSWTSYPPHHMDGFDATSEASEGRRRRHRVSARPHPARLPRSPRDAEAGRAGRPRRNAVRRDLEGRAAADHQAREVRHRDAGAGRVRRAGCHYKNLPRRIMALSDAFNEELHDLADAGCQVIQMEEPQIHLLAARGFVDKRDQPGVHAQGVQQHRARGCAPRPKCGATPAGATRRSSACSRRCKAYKPALDILNQVDADVITFEMAAPARVDLEAIGRADHGQESRHRRDRSSHAAGRVAGGSRRARPPALQAHSGRAPDPLVRTAAWAARA